LLVLIFNQKFILETKLNLWKKSVDGKFVWAKSKLNKFIRQSFNVKFKKYVKKIFFFLVYLSMFISLSHVHLYVLKIENTYFNLVNENRSLKFVNFMLWMIVSVKKKRKWSHLL
jgi:hypothetical protein